MPTFFDMLFSGIKKYHLEVRYIKGQKFLKLHIFVNGGNQMLRKTMKVIFALLTVVVMYIATPSAGIAALQWNRMDLPGKTPAGAVAVIGMSPNFPSDNVTFMADGVSLYESKDRGKNWTNTISQSPYGLTAYIGCPTAKAPTARIYVPQNFESSGLVVLSNEMSEINYAYLSTGSTEK